jgi:hypothetical protein
MDRRNETYPMQDDQLISDLESQLPHTEEKIALLRQHGITTYSQLFALLRDESADAELREHGCWVLIWAREMVDKRRAVPPLLTFLHSAEAKGQQAAAHALGILRSRRAVPSLIALIANRHLPAWFRAGITQSLCDITDPRISEFLRPVMFDQTEEVLVRSEAIEWIEWPNAHNPEDWLPGWITLLGDSASDIRFWAAYRLSLYSGNLTSALSALDQLVAFDHSVPTYWGWHIDREAICALETAYMHAWMGYPEDDADFCAYGSHPWLISPAAEYESHVRQYRQFTEGGVYETKPAPPVTLNIDPDWLTDQLRQQWPEVEINARQPRPQAYLLDWRMLVEKQILSGALHRDHYAVVLTGSTEAVKTFARWYRGIIPPEQPLFFYEWAGEGEVLV